MNYAEYVEKCQLVIDVNLPILQEVIEKNDYLFEVVENGPSYIGFKTDYESEDFILFFGIDSDGLFKTRVVFKGREIGFCSGDLFTETEGAAVFNSVLSSLYYVNRHTHCKNLMVFIDELCRQLTRVERAYELIYQLYIQDEDDWDDWEDDE